MTDATTIGVSGDARTDQLDVIGHEYAGHHCQAPKCNRKRSDRDPIAPISPARQSGNCSARDGIRRNVAGDRPAAAVLGGGCQVGDVD